MKKRTRVTHLPRVAVPGDNRPLVAPIYQSVKFTFDDVGESQRYFAREREGFYYSRDSNPTLRQLELVLAELQGRDACLLTGSGVAAVALPLLGLLRSGDHVVYRNCYRKATKGARSLVQCDADLNYSAVAECQLGEGVALLDDCYNSSPDALEAAVVALSLLPGRRRVADVAAERIARVRGIGDHAASAQDGRRLPDETRLGIGGVHLEELSHDRRGDPRLAETGQGAAL